ncbi:MAG: hypothetical protein Q9177_004372 [Variospora cf. flavescens]
MDRLAKRRRLGSLLQIPMVEKARAMGDVARIQDSMMGNKDVLDKELLHVAISDIPKVALPRARRSLSFASSQGKEKLQRLHPRNFIAGRGVDDVANPVVQPVQTAVASFINVVLDQGGTSVGDILVPAESTIFNVDGYGPVTINTDPPIRPTPSPQDQDSSPNLPPASPDTQEDSSVPQQTPQPASGPSPQAQPTAAATQDAPPQQSIMSIEVPESISQVILASPSTPLPPSPSNSTSSATGSESYFGSSSSQAISTIPTSTDPNISFSQSAIASQSPQITNGGFGPPRANELIVLLVSPSRTSSGTATLPVIVTPNSNSATISSSSFDSFPTSGFLITSTTSSNSTSTRNTLSSSTTPALSSTTSTSSTLSSASASDTGIPGVIGGPTGTAGGQPASTATAAAGSGGGGVAPTPTIVGSVVGSVAGLALILVLILFLLRRRKRLGQQRTISPPIPQSASTGPGANTGTMTERSSVAIPLTGAGAGAGFFRRLRPGSGATATTTETTPSERGFQNLGGRKLQSVLSTRGDGFGDVPFGAAAPGATPGASSSRGPAPPSVPLITAGPGVAPGHSSPESLDGSSFYRDSQGFYGGPAPGPSAPEPASNSSSMFVGPGSPPQSPALPPPSIQLPPTEGVAVMRPGPARTPVTTQPSLSPMRGSPRPQRGTPPPPHIPGTIQERPRDGLGRSHPSLDGSRSSRFAENI